MSDQSKHTAARANDDTPASTDQGNSGRQQGEEVSRQSDGKFPDYEQGREHRPNVNAQHADTHRSSGQAQEEEKAPAAHGSGKPNEGENEDPGSRIVGDDQQARKPGTRSAQRDSLHNAHGDR